MLKVVFTGGMLLIAYLLTVNVRQKRKIKYLGKEIKENQIIIDKLILKYHGKEKDSEL